MGKERSGILYLVATPIGNLEDISLRALRVLREVDLIAAEDTRHTRKLLYAHGIRTPIVSYHEQGQAENRVRRILKELKNGRDVALVSEAGTPGISDPGHRLVVRCIEEQIQVTAVPGPSILLAALSISGLPADRFAFEGFLPRRKGQVRRTLEALRGDDRTLVFFESPNRLPETLKIMLEVLGDRRAALARELTKRFEEVVRGRLSDLIRRCEDGGARGEVTLLVEGAHMERPSLREVEEMIQRLEYDCDLNKRQLQCVIHRITGIPKKEIYSMLHGDQKGR